MNQERIVRAGLIQQSCSLNADENMEKAVSAIRKAAAQGVKIVCTQELFRTRYFCQEEKCEWFDLAEPIPGPSCGVFAPLAKELGIVIIASLFERRMAGVYHNTAVVFGPSGEMIGKYRKAHIPDDPLYYEKYYFAPGDLGFPAFNTPFGRIGVLICWDQWFPEAARAMALAGAEILFYPTAIGWHAHEKESFGQRQHQGWEVIQRGHAVANGIYVCAVNRTGSEGSVQFFGQSFIADPFGEVLCRASVDNEEIIVQDLDLSLIEDTRRNWPFLRDRRIDAYSPILQRCGGE